MVPIVRCLQWIACDIVEHTGKAKVASLLVKAEPKPVGSPPPTTAVWLP
jgi:hypothetical protein